MRKTVMEALEMVPVSISRVDGARTLTFVLTLLLCSPGPAAALSAFTQDFEGLVASDPSALANDGWLVFGNVFDPSGSLLYGYGPFAAPNDGSAFSQLAGGEGGPNQGTLVLNTFSDYNNTDHAVGFIIESNVFQEQLISATDVGTIWRFRFDAKPSDAFGGLQPPTTTQAFIKTVDPNAGFALTNFLTHETTNYPSLWQEGVVIDIPIDASLAGQLLQFGFLSQSSNYAATGVFYDNVSFGIVPEPGTGLLLAMGVMALAAARRQR